MVLHEEDREKLIMEECRARAEELAASLYALSSDMDAADYEECELMDIQCICGALVSHVRYDTSLYRCLERIVDMFF